MLIEGENVSGVQPADYADHQFWLQVGWMEWGAKHRLTAQTDKVHNVP